MADHTVPIKQFRSQLAHFADLVQQGQTVEVIRSSRPAFTVVPCGSFAHAEAEWETVIDFTEQGKYKGARAEDALAVLKKLNKA